MSGDGPTAQELCRMLRKRRFRAEAAVSMAEALAKIEQYTPSLVLIDFHLADGTGVELASRLRDMPRTAKLPVLMLATAFQAEHYRAHLGPEGPQGWLHKPVDESTLAKAVQLWIGARVRDRSRPVESGEIESTRSLPEGGGTFAELPVARVLVLAGRRGRGQLVIERHEHWLRISLKKDAIEGVSSSYIDAISLGRMLLLSGRINSDALRDAQPAVAAGTRLGEWLIEHGLLTKEELYQHLRQQITVKLTDLFSWRWYDAAWTYDPTDLPLNEHVAEHLGLKDIVFTGIAKYYDRDRLEMIFTKRRRLQRPLIPTTPHVDDLPVAARRILQAADGRSISAQVRARAGMEVLRFYQIVYALWVLDLVRFGDPVEDKGRTVGLDDELFFAARETVGKSR